MESRLLKPILAVYVGLFLLFLYGPFIVLGILSFQKGPEGGPQFPIEEWSLFWYRHVLGLAPPSRVSPLPIGISLVRSLTLAFMTMVTSTVLGVMAAQAFRRNFWGHSLVFYLIVLGMIVPGVLVGLGSALVATTTGIERHWYTTAFATHVVYTLPFCFLVMLAIFNRFDSSVEEAAWSLGVSPATTFRKITFPLIFPGCYRRCCSPSPSHTMSSLGPFFPQAANRPCRWRSIQRSLSRSTPTSSPLGF
jgi:putative spermidine/putrescine transport system permease protein